MKKPNFLYSSQTPTKLKASSGSPVKSKLSLFFHFDTCAGPNLISKSIIPLSWRNRIQYCNDSLSRAANKTPLELKCLTPLLVQIGDLELRVRFGAVNEFAVVILVRKSLRNCNVRGIFRATEKITLRNSRPAYDSALRRKRRKSLNATGTNYVCNVTENPSKKQAICCTTNGENIEIETVRTCCVYNGRPGTYRVKITNAGRKTRHSRQDRSKHSLANAMSSFSDALLNEIGSSTGKDGTRTWH